MPNAATRFCHECGEYLLRLFWRWHRCKGDPEDREYERLKKFIHPMTLTEDELEELYNRPPSLLTRFRNWRTFRRFGRPPGV